MSFDFRFYNGGIIFKIENNIFGCLNYFLYREIILDFEKDKMVKLY